MGPPSTASTPAGLSSKYRCPAGQTQIFFLGKNRAWEGGTDSRNDGLRFGTATGSADGRTGSARPGDLRRRGAEKSLRSGIYTASRVDVRFQDSFPPSSVAEVDAVGGFLLAGKLYARTVSGSQLKWLSVVDEYTRGRLALKVDRGITSEDVMDTLSELFAMRGVPRHICSDNGPAFIAHALRRWLGRWVSMPCTSSRAALGRTATPSASTAALRDEFLAMNLRWRPGCPGAHSFLER